MHKVIFIAAASAILLAGCGEEAPPPAQEAERAPPSPGLYELSWSDVEINSTDEGEPATGAGEGEAGAGAAFTDRTCVGEDGTIPLSAFAEAGDECTATSSFVRNGRISLQLECRREGQPGQVLQTVNGTSTAEGFEAEVSTTTYFSGTGDYEMSRTVTGRRVGECPAEGAGEAAGEGNAAQ